MTNAQFNQIINLLSLYAHDIDTWAEIRFQNTTENLHGVAVLIENHLGEIFSEI